MKVWLVYRCTSDQYGRASLVGIYSTKEIAEATAATLVGFQHSVKEVDVHEDKQDFAKLWMDK